MIQNLNSHLNAKILLCKNASNCHSFMDYAGHLSGLSIFLTDKSINMELKK
jgi:hypothetical protein